MPDQHRRTCYRCLEPPEPGRMHCKKHRESRRAVEVRYYARRKAAGICVACREPAAEGRVLCQKHNALNAAAVAKTQAARKAAGTCVDCGGPLAAGSRSHCDAHRDYHNEQSRAYAARRARARRAREAT